MIRERLNDRLRPAHAGGPYRFQRLTTDPHHRHWRCYLGHVASARELLESADDHVEAALWSAVRALYEHATTLDALARDAAELGVPQSATDYMRRAKETRDQAEVARRFMLELIRTPS